MTFCFLQAFALMVLVTEQLKMALKKGANTIAVHSHEGGRGQFIDLAILVE